MDDLTNLVESVVFPSLFSADGHMIISSTPADTRSHPLYTYRTSAEQGGWIVKVPIWEANRMDPKAYPLELINEWKKETLKAPDGQYIWEREYECKWVINQKKAVVPEWNTNTMVMPFGRDPYDQFYHRYMGLDWGYKDYTALVFATLNFRKSRLEVDGELTFSGNDVRSDLIADRVNLWKSHNWKDREVYRQVSDSADPILINEINRFKGMSFMPVKKDTLSAMINEFRILVMQGKIVVSPKCPMLIHCLENAIWVDETKRDELDQDIVAHHFDHLMALVYMARMVDWNANPIPKDFMIDNVRVIDLNFDKQKAENASGHALQEAFARPRVR